MNERRPRPSSGSDIRCECGKLLAQWHSHGIMIKCARCRRLVHIPFAAIRAAKTHHPPD